MLADIMHDRPIQSSTTPGKPTVQRLQSPRRQTYVACALVNVGGQKGVMGGVSTGLAILGAIEVQSHLSFKYRLSNSFQHLQWDPCCLEGLGICKTRWPDSSDSCPEILPAVTQGDNLWHNSQDQMFEEPSTCKLCTSGGAGWAAGALALKVY